MSIAGLIAALIAALLTLAWIAAPLLRRATAGGDDALIQKQRERLLMVYERVLTNIRDLDEDHTTGKMPTGDYEFEREMWVQRGIQALKVLDELDAEHAIIESPDVEAIDRAIDRKIEDAVAAYRTRTDS